MLWLSVTVYRFALINTTCWYNPSGPESCNNKWLLLYISVSYNDQPIPVTDKNTWGYTSTPPMPLLYLFHFTLTSAFLNVYAETQIWVTELLCLGQETMICMSIFQHTHTNTDIWTALNEDNVTFITPIHVYCTPFFTSYAWGHKTKTGLMCVMSQKDWEMLLWWR
jgi:hypothetical protein